MASRPLILLPPALLPLTPLPTARARSGASRLRAAWRACTRAMLPLLLPLLLAACGGARPPGPEHGPGPAGDPWGPYIAAAAEKYSIPQRWIRAVMQRESGGHQYLGGRPITSSSGAAGLMQILPSTYGKLASRYGLGDDPYDPHDNIFAGAALIRELYDRYGSPGFLAAYTAGTRRMDAYLAGQEDLPDSTIAYVAAAAPQLGNDPPMSGKLAQYGGAAAYAQAPPQAAAPAASLGLIAPAYAETQNPAGGQGWAAQVGAYPQADQARAALARARSLAPGALATGTAVVGIIRHDGADWYRARFSGLSRAAASEACSSLSAAGMSCWAAPPGS